jgi:hypothetical protein
MRSLSEGPSQGEAAKKKSMNLPKMFRINQIKRALRFLSCSGQKGHHKYDCHLEYRLAASEVDVSHAKFDNLLCIGAWFPELEKDANFVG